MGRPALFATKPFRELRGALHPLVQAAKELASRPL